MARSNVVNPTKAAGRKRNTTVRHAAARRDAREATGEQLVQPKSSRALKAAARSLLKRHQIKELPGTMALAKIHIQMHDAVDALYDVTVRQQKEQRQISAMVSAAKIAIFALEKLGLPGEDIEEDEAVAHEVIAEKAGKKAKPTDDDGDDAPDGLEAYE